MTLDIQSIRELERIAGAAMEAQVIRSFAMLDLADHMARARGSAHGSGLTELASATGCRPALLGRLLRAAAGLGLCTLNGGVYELTPLGETVRSDVPDSMRARALLLSAPWLNRPWEGLTDGIRSGRTPFTEHHGEDIWEYLDSHVQDAVTFNSAMADNVGRRAAALVRSAVLPADGTIVDVGGGTGRLLDGLLALLPEARGILADRAIVLKEAYAFLATRRTRNRVTLVATNFLERVPSGGNVYLLSRVLHNWAEEDADKILTACRRSMPAEARLFVLERMGSTSIDQSGIEAVETALTDLNMFVLYGGQERTAHDYQSLLINAGFKRIRILTDSDEFGMIEAS